MKHAYKVIENHWGDIFIIKSGLRVKKLGTFHTLNDARAKCDELNEEAKKEAIRP